MPQLTNQTSHSIQLSNSDVPQEISPAPTTPTQNQSAPLSPPSTNSLATRTVNNTTESSRGRWLSTIHHRYNIMLTNPKTKLLRASYRLTATGTLVVLRCRCSAVSSVVFLYHKKDPTTASWTKGFSLDTLTFYKIQHWLNVTVWSLKVRFQQTFFWWLDGSDVRRCQNSSRSEKMGSSINDTFLTPQFEVFFSIID